MKKVLSIFLVLLMAMMALTACGGSGDSDSGDAGDAAPVTSVEELKTIGDIMALEASDYSTAVYEDQVVYAFKLGDTYYRAKADISPEDAQAYWDVDYTAEDYEEQEAAIISPLEIREIENLSEQILSEEDCAALVGKTGQELQDAGWTYSGHDLESMEFWMEYGPFVYTVVFDGEVAEADYETFEDEAGTKDMAVKSVTFSDSLGSRATDIE